MTRVFFLGATGCVGGSVLVALREAYPEVHFTLLVRSASDGEKLKSTRTTIVLGDFTDYKKVISLVAEADIVINTADCDDVSLANAILAGLKQRQDQGRGVGTLIHTSGELIFKDDVTDGTRPPNRKVWSDENEEAFKILKPEQLHAPVDIPILKAGEDGITNTFILCPAIVYGPSRGPCRKSSIFYKFLSTAFIASGQASVVGEGNNVHGTIHIDDLVSVYLHIFNKTLENGLKLLPSSAYARYYIVTDQEATQIDLATWVAAALNKVGKIRTAEVKHISPEEAGTQLLMAGNSLSVGVRAKEEFGWSPKAPAMSAEIVEKDIRECIEIGSF